MWCVQACRGTGLDGVGVCAGEGGLRLKGRQGLDHSPEELDGAADLKTQRG